MAKKPLPPEPVQTLMLGNLPVTTGRDSPSRMAIMLWGPATAGKTTWAATAPGKKLWLSFGDNEHVPVSHRSDVLVVKLYGLSRTELFRQAQNDNPFNLDAFLETNVDIATVVVDSVTAIEYLALQKSVLDDRIGAGRDFTPSMEAPGISAYGGRNAILIETLSGILRVTAKHNCHVVMIAHEADAVMRKENNVEVIDYIAVQLGGKIINAVTWRFSEFWFLSQRSSGKRERQLMIRPFRNRRPVKTRIFDHNSTAEFVLTYDPEKPDDAKGQMTIAGFYEEWLDNGKTKVKPPSGDKPE